MRVKMLNRYTGTVMYVDGKREAEYRAAGHKLVDDDLPVEIIEEPAPKQKKKAPKKAKQEGDW